MSGREQTTQFRAWPCLMPSPSGHRHLPESGRVGPRPTIASLAAEQGSSPHFAIVPMPTSKGRVRSTHRPERYAELELEIIVHSCGNRVEAIYEWPR